MSRRPVEISRLNRASRFACCEALPWTSTSLVPEHRPASDETLAAWTPPDSWVTSASVAPILARIQQDARQTVAGLPTDPIAPRSQDDLCGHAARLPTTLSVSSNADRLVAVAAVRRFRADDRP
jgi:hypothetical protein